MRQFSVVLGLASLAAASVAALPVAASASCAEAPTLATAIAKGQTVFVGTVTGLDDGARIATVHVDDLWKGNSVSAVVQVVGTPDLSAAATSVDRTFTAGQQYLFIPTSGSIDRFQDNNCTLTQPYSASLSGLRPTGAPGTPKNASGFDFPILQVVAGVVAIHLVVASIVGLALYRRRASRVPREA
jgi:hypothetical protein